MSWLIRTAMFCAILLSTHASASIGKVSLLKGEAFAQRDSTQNSLQTGSPIEGKDIVTTAKESRAQLLFEDKTVITLGSETAFRVEEYLSGASNAKAKFKFNQGSFKVITGTIGKNAPENFTIETKTATIGIRGTWIEGVIEADGDWISCNRGQISVSSLKGGKIVTVPEGYRTFVGLDKDPLPPTHIPQGGDDTLKMGDNEMPQADKSTSDNSDYNSLGYWSQSDMGDIDKFMEKIVHDDLSKNPNDIATNAEQIATLHTAKASYTYTGTVDVPNVNVQLASGGATEMQNFIGTIKFIADFDEMEIKQSGSELILRRVSDGALVTAKTLESDVAITSGGSFSSASTTDDDEFSISGRFYNTAAQTARGTVGFDDGSISSGDSIVGTGTGTFTATRP